MHDAFIKLLESARELLENDIINDLMLNMITDEGLKNTMRRVFETFNAHGVTSRTILEVITEVSKDGAKMDATPPRDAE